MLAKHLCKKGFDMIQIIKENRKPTTGERFNKAFGTGLNILQEHQQKQKLESQYEQENEAAKRMGFDISGFSDPELRKVLLTQKLKQMGKQESQEREQNFLNSVLSNGKIQNDVGPQLSSSNPESSNFDPTNISDEDIVRATSIKPALGASLRSAKDAALKKIENEKKENLTKFQSDREYHSKVSQPIIDAAQESLKQAPIKKGLIDQQRRDIASGQIEGIIPFMVDQTGLEFWRNPESARFKTASKQRFVETLHELGGSSARANQFIEQQLVSAQPTIGRDAESNETVLDLEEFVEDMKNQRAKLELQLAEEDREKYGYAKNDIAQRADKQMGNFANKRQDQMAYSIRQRHEDKLSDEELVKEIVSGKIVSDTPLTLRAARILMIKNNDNVKKAQAEAKKLGFKIPKE